MSHFKTVEAKLRHNEISARCYRARRSRRWAMGLTSDGKIPHFGTHRQIQTRKASNRYWKKKAAEFRALGLTTRGTVRKYNLLETHLTGRRRKNLRQRIYRRNLIANGFTTRGRDRWTPKERQWRQFRATLNIGSAKIWEKFVSTAERSAA